MRRRGLPKHLRFETGDCDMVCSEDELGRLAKRRIEAGELPCYVVTHMWGSHGSGGCCALCHRPIGIEEIEYEVASDPEADQAAVTLCFHLGCHAIWQAECARAGAGAAAD